MSKTEDDLKVERTGLEVNRFFTKPGVHPYDEIEWDVRDAVIPNYKDGGNAFEQRDVEFPKSWSQNATNIVAQKYFRGPLETPQRERSVRQLVDRVADTIAGWGWKDGYFASEADRDTFNHELKQILVTQKAAFNSPVWFNVGVEASPQSSACFILAVEDRMSSILNWYVEEGTIFKGGSGSGINLSTIRSSKEKLSAGGEASGPVSFMRGADASAGTIKSGGKTRRAAKMVILNVDHPDVEDFIWCKAIEERKARALREGGFDMDLDGRDSYSIQYQNANNSVRVTDEFMSAVANDEDWTLRAVLDGKPVKTIRARDLMREVAQAAWECADPGMQYDTTINDWHTCPEAGRINASNPCSEYMHLDNSACNLASLNLMKFVDDDMNFDIKAFKHAVDIIFLSQEIIVGNSSYPTEAIGKNAVDYRQLGIGYANLGALLMARGLAYDSEGGRAWAGVITALLTGWSYRDSALFAKVQGPFAGFAPNRDAMTRVIQKHRDAVEAIDPELVPEGLLQAAKDAWDQALVLGREHGWRNAQSSVLAPTGCLVGGSLVPTERGLVRLASLGDPAGAQWQNLEIDVATDAGPRKATQFYVNGWESVVTVDTRRGYRIQGTPRHRVKVVENGDWVWKRFSDIAPGDTVPLALDQLVGRPKEVDLPPLPDMYWTSERHVDAPRRMSPELAEVVGYFMGDGSLHSRSIRLCVDSKDFDVVERLRILGKELFGIEAKIAEKKGYTEVSFQSVRLVQWWEACGFAKTRPHESHSGKGYTPSLPDAVLHANDPEVYRAFVRGLFEADGTVTSGYPHWSTTATGFSRDVQTLLLALGFPTTRKYDTTGWGQSQLAVLRLLNGEYNARWLHEIGFMSSRKNFAVHVSDGRQAARADHIPVSQALIDRAAPTNGRNRKTAMMEVRRNGTITRRLARELYASSKDEELGRLLCFFYDRVASAELGSEELTYDLSVPDNVTYVANGFVSHNTIGLMMDCDTTGIEPDLALVKNKKLVGGGSMKIVNQTVPRALRRLGYAPNEVEQITAHIAEHNTVDGAPFLKPEHFSVFDTAMGERAIHYMGHVHMMAAVQPCISGAISKCVTGDTLLTTEDGLVRIHDLHEGEQPDSFRDHIVAVASLEGIKKTDAFYYGGVKQVREILLRSGHRVVGTFNHRLLVANEAGLTWKRLDEISQEDYVSIRYGADMWSQVPARFDAFRSAAPYGSQKNVRVPAEMTEGLAFLLGAYAAEGHTTRSNWTVTITNSSEDVLARVVEEWRRQFGIEARVTRQAGKCPGVVIAGKTVVEFLEWLGCGSRASAKRIPDAVLRSPRAMVLAFLQGLALDACVAWMGTSPKWAICLDSAPLLDDLQAVLTNLGIVHSRIEKANAQYGKSYGEVYVVGEQAQRMIELVPFLEEDKRSRAEVLLVVDPAQSPTDVVPGIAPRELYELIPRGKSRRNGFGSRSEFAFLCDPRTRNVSRRTLERISRIPGVVLPEALQAVLRDGLHFSPVERVQDGGGREVYDISVPETHAFLGNGIVNHNTVNMPESASVEEVENLYIEGWKLGLKALAIYRDNCKVAQPLSAEKKVKVVDPAVVATGQPHRKRLPKSRPSITTSFRVADAEGYLLAGMYPDDGLGEIFLKVSKQGSTLSGVMDALAISVSIGLQYGVPLEAYVQKFMNMRFEPSGMTDDPDIRFATSIADYIFRRLAIDHLDDEARARLGIMSTSERRDAVTNGHDAEGGTTKASARTPEIIASPELKPNPQAAIEVKYSDAPLCYNCGNKMRPAGSCFVCEGCGSTSGCS